jgi:hypothetical protein
MKRRIIRLCGLFTVFVSFLPVISEASGRGLSFGASVGGSPHVWFYHSYKFGGELGYQFTNRIGLMADSGLAFTSYSYQSSGAYFTSSSKTTLTSVPISLSVLFLTQVKSGFSAYLGLGGGHYSISIKEETEDAGTYADPARKTETHKLKSLAPHVSLGFESDLSRRFVIFGEVRQIIGKEKLKKTDSYGYSTAQDVYFGGTEVKVGLRFYLKEAKASD